MREGGARWLTVAAVLASFFWMLGAAPLFDVDEGAFSQATLEMFQRGDFLSTTLNGEPRYDKPIAILIPFATTFVFCWLRRDLKTWARAVFDWRALLLLLVIAAPWYVVILLKEGRGFIDGFIMKHNVGRFSGPVSGHTGSLLYYFPVVLILSLPFTALLVPLALRIRTVWRDDLQLYLLLWFAFVFVFFSLSGTKLPHYVLYGYTGLAVLMAVHGDVEAAFWPMVPVLAFFLALLGLPYVVNYSLGHVPDAFYREVL